MKIDKKVIKELSDYLDEFKLTEIEITEKDTKIKVSKNNVSTNSQPQIISSSSALNKEASLVAENITGDLTSLQFKSNTAIEGVITSVKLDSGTVIAYLI